MQLCMSDFKKYSRKKTLTMVLSFVLPLQLLFFFPKLHETSYAEDCNKNESVLFIDQLQLDKTCSSRVSLNGESKSILLDMVKKIAEIWSKYHKYVQHTRNMVKIPDLKPIYQKYSQSAKNMVNIPKI